MFEGRMGNGPLKIRALAILLLLLMSILPQATIASTGGDDDGNSKEKWKVTRSGTKLPDAIYRSSLAWTGEKAYIFSGRNLAGPVSTIYEFDPSTGKVVEKGAKIQKARIMATAAWLEPYAYIFGGGNYSEVLDEVLRYDPVQDKVEVLPYHMPTPRMGSSAVAVGEYIYIVGGKNVTVHMSEVLRFHPATGAFERLPDMPVPGGGRTCASDGERVYLFGGCGSCGNDTVFDIVPSSGASRLLEVQTDYGYYWSTGVWTGESALIFGGNDFTSTLDQLLVFKPDGKGGGKIDELDPLPKPIELAVSFYDQESGKAYLLGGRSTEFPSDDIYVFSKRDKGTTQQVRLSQEGAAVAVGLMVFTVAIVAFQSMTGGSGKSSKKEGGNRKVVPPPLKKKGK